MVLAGRYQLEQRVGSGGMGEVWRAFDQVLGRTVAVKCLLGGQPDEPAFVDQFRAEARIMATISHPGVVEVHDFGDDPAVGVYLVMKFIDGESLAQTLSRVGRLSPEATMRLVAEAAEALQAAHERGVTHRDIKPGNLLLRTDGTVLVTDFGIARSSSATGHTTTGTLVGTAGYMAPERALGQPATPASDIYALGVVAYRCLAGNVPFAGDSVVEVALRHVHDQAGPLPSDVPPGVRALVERAMAKDPAQRWPSGAALAAQARRVLAEGPGQPLRAAAISPAVASAVTRPQAVASVPTRVHPAPGGRRRSRRLLVLAAVGLVVAGLAAAGIALSGAADGQPQNLATSPGAGVPSLAGDAASAATSPDATSPLPTPSLSGSAAAPSAGPTKPAASAKAGPLAAPTGLTATAIDATTVRLRWSDQSSEETGFTVIDGARSRNVGANVTTYDWTGVPAATHTCFKVRAYNASGESAYFPAAQGDWVCVTTLQGVGPAAPSAVLATAISSSAIKVQWTDGSSDEDGFTIHNGQTSRNALANTQWQVWEGLAPGTYMCFRVRSYTASGVSAYVPGGDTWACATTPAS